MLRRAFLSALAISSLPGLALAHGLEAGPHGGAVADATPGPDLHIEIVVKGKTVQVYIINETGKPLLSAGVSGNVTVLANKKKTIVTLTQAGLDALSGTGDFESDPQMRALVLLTVAGVEQRALFSSLTGK